MRKRFTMPKVLFVNLLSTPLDNVEATFRNENRVIQEVVMPLGIMYLSAYLKKAGVSATVGLVDYAIHADEMTSWGNLDNFIREIAKADAGVEPDIIAFSVNLSTSHHFFLKAAGILKGLWPGAKVIAGGVHATNYTRRILQEPYIDAVIRGEGEVALAEFVRRFPLEPGERVAGIVTREDAHGGGDMELSPLIADLDEIPFPDYDLIDPSYFRRITRFPKKHLGQDKLMAELMTTRGCPGRCSFCSSHTVHGRKVRYRSVENVVAEVRYLHERYGVTLFFPEDDYFTANKKRTMTLLAALKKLGIPGFEMQFPNGLAVNSLDEELIDALIDAGMKMATLAIESASEVVQRTIIHKFCNLPKAREMIAVIRGKGLMVRCYFILGFPGETRAQMEETIDFARTAGADWQDFFVATPLVGSEMYDDFARLGLVSGDPEAWRTSYFWERRFDTPEISAADLNELNYRANLEVNFVHNVNLREGRWREALDLFLGILAKYPFHIIGWYCVALCHRGLGDEGAAREAEARISRLIEEDSRSRDMFRKYGAFMEGYPGPRTARTTEGCGEI
jgi:anaerobic magnesium-protoporphyrin IX monomethyl ester cyclase